MKINKKIVIILVSLFVLTTMAIIYLKQIKPKTKPEPWFVMSRHGECVSLEKVINYDNLFKGAKTLHDMEMILQIKKIKYKIEATPPDRSRFIKFDVPSKDIGFMLIRKQYCQEFYEDF